MNEISIVEMEKVDKQYKHLVTRADNKIGQT